MESTDEFEPTRAKLEALFLNEKRKLAPAFDFMSSIIKLARSCGINRKILFHPILSRNAEVSCSDLRAFVFS